MLIPVILSGGAGTRLWPVSREGHPKPFMKLSDGQTLLHKTYQRAASITDGPEILTVTNRDYYFMSKDELALTELPENRHGVFLLEPAGRNTAPAVALAAHHLVEKYGCDVMMLVLAADHLIGDVAAFKNAVDEAVQLANAGKLVTFGIVPDAPETGFGYIESDGNQVTRFIEKPSLEKAREYVAADNFLWNSGMFCFKAEVILEQLAKHAPEVACATETCWSAMHEDVGRANLLEIPADKFSQVPDISVDYAVMEPASQAVDEKDGQGIVMVVPGDFGWSDIGSWNAISQLIDPDESNNRILGEAILIDSNNTFVQSEDRLVAGVGLHNLMVIDTPDALLIANPDKAQDVRKVVTQLKKRDHEAYRLHRTVSRPWGTYTVLEEGPRFKIKRIEVKPGAALSLQMHHHRSEHWIVVSGMAKVVNGDQEKFVNTNESTYIPAGHKHRLENPGILELVMIEVQSGSYLGEDDIVRFEDVYGRTPSE